MKHTVGALVPAHHEVLDALAALPGVLATLNYDSFIVSTLSFERANKPEDALMQVIAGVGKDKGTKFRRPCSPIVSAGLICRADGDPNTLLREGFATGGHSVFSRGISQSLV